MCLKLNNYFRFFHFYSLNINMPRNATRYNSPTIGEKIRDRFWNEMARKFYSFLLGNIYDYGPLDATNTFWLANQNFRSICSVKWIASYIGHNRILYTIICKAHSTMGSSNSELKSRRRNRLIIVDYPSHIQLWLIDSE